jgi:hypothetical protein
MQDVNENNGHFETEFTSSEIPSKKESDAQVIASGKDTTESFSKNWDDDSKKATSRDISKPKASSEITQSVIGIQQETDAYNFDVNGK